MTDNPSGKPSNYENVVSLAHQVATLRRKLELAEEQLRETLARGCARCERMPWSCAHALSTERCRICWQDKPDAPPLPKPEER